MSKFIFGLLIALVVGSIVDDVNNNPASTWFAVEYPPEVVDIEKIRSHLLRPWKESEKKPYISSNVRADNSFDARDFWPGFIQNVRDQADCGSCWAFAVAETVTDRVAIEKYQESPWFSPQDLVSCDTDDDGCDGGGVSRSWQYVLKTGLAFDECIPYTSGDGSARPCPSKCANGSNIVRTKATSVYPVTDMQTELSTKGPFEVAFTVYADFLNYKGGVYQHLYGDVDGGHAVLAIGWGVEDTTPYWLIQNSWSIDWGEQGYFKILRGNDECGIESSPYAGIFN